MSFDKAEWQYDSARESYCETYNKNPDSLTDEGVTFWYDDGDLFWGHTVTVDSSADGMPRYAQMLGGS